MKEVKTAIYCYLHHCISLLLWSASLCPSSSSLAHDKRGDWLRDRHARLFSGCLPAAVTQQLLQKFIWLDEGQTVKQYGGYRHRSTQPPPSWSCPWPHSSLSVPHQQWDQTSTVLIPYAPAVSYFRLLFIFNGTLCVLVYQMYQPHL